MDLILTGNDALAVDIVATKVMKLDWKKTYLNYIANKSNMNEETSTPRAYSRDGFTQVLSHPESICP